MTPSPHLRHQVLQMVASLWLLRRAFALKLAFEPPAPAPIVSIRPA